MSPLRRVRSVTAAAPGLYRAARDLLGRRDAARVVVAAALALGAGILRARGRPRMQNAVRHFTWSAWLSLRYGSATAERLTDQHERHSVDALDSEADLRNNTAGRAYADRHRDALADDPLALWRISGIGRRRWRAGRLWSVRGGRVERSAPTATPRS